MKRPEPLPRCPSARCRRAKRCIAALDDLYCRRTHFTLEEQRAIRANSPLQQALNRVPPAIDPDDPAARLERIKELAAIRRSFAQEMREKWQRGDFDALYGPNRPQGVILHPPEKAYVEPAK